MRVGKWGGFVVLLCACAVLIVHLATESSTASSHRVSARECGSDDVSGSWVGKLETVNVSCAQAERMLVIYHNKGWGLDCLTSIYRPPSDIRCTGRVPAGPNPVGSPPRFVTVVISYDLVNCAACGV